LVRRARRLPVGQTGEMNPLVTVTFVVQVITPPPIGFRRLLAPLTFLDRPTDAPFFGKRMAPSSRIGGQFNSIVASA
jgi:hypothetical protein